MRKFIFIALILIALAVLIFVFFGNRNSDTTSGPIKVAASIKPVADLVKVIGGDKIESVTILPDGSSPHTYEPMAADLSKLVNTKIAFIIGLDLDDWSLMMLKSGAVRDYKVTKLSDNIELLPSIEEDEPGDDPHYWLSYSNAEIMVKKISSELAEIDPNNKDYYFTNAIEYIKLLTEAKKQAQEKVDLLEQKEIVTFHSAFQYFAKDIGLEVVATIEPFAGSEPTPQYLAEVGKTINEYNISVLFREPQLSDSVVTAIANDYDASIETLNPMGNAGESYLEMMQYNVDTIVNALSK